MMRYVICSERFWPRAIRSRQIWQKGMPPSFPKCRPLFQKGSKIQNGNIDVSLRSGSIFLGLDLARPRTPRRFALDSRLIAPGNKGLRCWAKCRLNPQLRCPLRKLAQHKPRPWPKRKLRSRDWQKWAAAVCSSVDSALAVAQSILCPPVSVCGKSHHTQLSVSMV